jgi:hypothetical protein
VVANGQSFSMQIIADNDFAVFGGTATSITSLIYQNDFSWPDQLDNLSTFSFDLQPGQTTFYLLGMGGGGTENISGTINDTDITSINVSMSSDLSSYLSGYFISDGDGGTTDAAADGTYDASLADVQIALPNLTWGAPTPTDPGVDDVAARSPNGQGYHFDPDTAHLFSLSASDVGVTAVPEPATSAFLAVVIGFFGIKMNSRRRVGPQS